MYASNEWDRLDYRPAGTKFKVNELGPVVEAELVEFSHREKDRWNEPIQGEDECHIIFKVGDRYFKKTGYESSYDEVISWNGEVIEVFPETKTVYEFRSKR